MTNKHNFVKDINVPSKEQIIIDGVDIIDCDYFYVEQETDQVKCDNYSGYCREHKNCPFKQLARKTQECEELKNKLTFSRKCVRYNADVITSQQKDIDHYRKALEEIEEIVKQTCRKRCTNDCLGTKKHCGYGAIFKIVNKAKLKENEQ